MFNRVSHVMLRLLAHTVFPHFSVDCVLELECNIRATCFLGRAESLLMECDVTIGRYDSCIYALYYRHITVYFG